MSRLLLSIVLSLYFLSPCAQHSFTSQYKFSDSIASPVSSNGFEEEQAAWEFSFIGEYSKALEVWDRQESKPSLLMQKDFEQFSKFKPVNAKDLLVQKAKTEQIIIINEAHHQPYHRVFTTSLLEALYKEGFRYFGAEALDAWDKDLNTRKYPLMKSGFYAKEPFFGNLVREALRIGFTVFCYETTRTGQNLDSGGVNLREIDQARNIKKILDKDPKAKILIHCGFGHLVETPFFSWGKAMAGRLTEYTGINPFTVAQVELTEHSSIDFENPYFKLLNPDYYAMFIDSAGTIFHGSFVFSDFDAMVYHPRSNWICGRPHWVFEGARQAFYIQEKINISFPCLVFAYLAEENTMVDKEDDMPIPFDVIELKDPLDKKALSLKKGGYTILVRDVKGKLQKLSVVIK